MTRIPPIANYRQLHSPTDPILPTTLARKSRRKSAPWATRKKTPSSSVLRPGHNSSTSWSGFRSGCHHPQVCSPHRGCRRKSRERARQVNLLHADNAASGIWPAWRLNGGRVLGARDADAIELKASKHAHARAPICN
jgi:hypothetical protein